MMARWRPLRVTAMAMVMTAVAAAAGAAVAVASLPRGASSSEPRSQGVELEDFYAPRQVTLIPVYGEALSARTSASGTVTRYSCAADGSWGETASNISVDGRALPNVKLPTPPWRDLSLGARGSDVEELQQWLNDTHHAVEATGLFDWQTLVAWRAAIGLEQTESASRADYVWVPSSFTIAACPLSTGDPLGGATVVASSAPTIRHFDVREIPAGSDIADQVVHVGDARVPLDKASISEAGAIEMLLSEQVVATSLATDPDAPIAATFELAKPIRAARIPPSAVVVDGERSCVFDEHRAFLVAIVDSTLGRSVVTFEGEAPSRILLAPSRASCPDRVESSEG